MAHLDPIPSYFKRTSALSEGEISICRKIIGESQPFGIYFNAALADLEAGQDNRWFHISQLGGLIMGIDFDGLRIFSIIGQIEEAALKVIATNPLRTEFHVPDMNATRIRDFAKNRILREDRLRYYLLSRSEPFQKSFADLRRLNMMDLPEVERFYANHYDGTIFSSWMLELPFFGLFVEGKLVAAGGAIVIDKLGKAANIGNFLTAPLYRGRGYGKIIAKRLINDLMEAGISIFTLGTTEGNVAAWKTYEAIGFRLIEQRTEIEISES